MEKEPETIEMRWHWPVEGINDREYFEICGNGKPIYSREELERYLKDSFCGKGRYSIVMAFVGVPEEDQSYARRYKERLVSLINTE